MPEFALVTYDEEKLKCFHCGSTQLYYWGEYAGIPYYKCKKCGRKFTAKDTWPRMKFEKKYIIEAITNYYNGMSTSKISQSFNDYHEIEVHKSTIWRWIIKYSNRVNKLTLTMHPRLSSVWVADETVIDVSGKKYWYWDIIDEGTRFLIATHFSRTRPIKDATKLFSMAKERSKTRPSLILTDKMLSYQDAFNAVFYTNIADNRVTHLTSEGFGSDTNINLIERFHSTIKQRTKVMRDLKKPTTASVLLDGLINHYNFFLEHSTLDGKTPAQAAGIGLGISNWGDLIDLTYKSPVVKKKVGLDGY